MLFFWVPRLEAFYRMGLCQHGLGDTKRAAASLQVAGRLLDKIQDRPERTAWTATIQQAMGALRVPRDVKPVANAGQQGDTTTRSGMRVVFGKHAFKK